MAIFCKVNFSERRASGFLNTKYMNANKNIIIIAVRNTASNSLTHAGVTTRKDNKSADKRTQVMVVRIVRTVEREPFALAVSKMRSITLNPFIFLYSSYRYSFRLLRGCFPPFSSQTSSASAASRAPASTLHPGAWPPLLRLVRLDRWECQTWTSMKNKLLSTPGWDSP